MGRVFFNTRKNVQNVDGAHTMAAIDSGKVLLPAASLIRGWNCKLIVKEDTPTGVITVAAGSAIIDLVMKDSGANASNSTAGTAVSNILIGTAAKQGDYINILCDGSTYYAECLSSTDDSITTS